MIRCFATTDFLQSAERVRVNPLVEHLWRLVRAEKCSPSSRRDPTAWTVRGQPCNLSAEIFACLLHEQCHVAPAVLGVGASMAQNDERNPTAQEFVHSRHFEVSPIAQIPEPFRWPTKACDPFRKQHACMLSSLLGKRLSLRQKFAGYLPGRSCGRMPESHQ